MGLDINTPLGQESLQQELKMLDEIKKCWNVDIILTDKKVDALCDGFLVRNNVIIALFESKCRNMTLNQLENYGSWLITYNKVEKCKTLSEQLKVPFLGFLYLVDDNIVMHWNITDKEGNYQFIFDHQETKTQKTINGGEIIRDNAYLPYNEGRIVHKILND